MEMLKEKLTAALKAKTNDVNSFVWKLAKDHRTGKQEEIKLMDATPEQLSKFCKHCNSMLYSADKFNPGRYILLDLIKEQRSKCNVELFLRDLESGKLTVDNKPYKRYLYCQDFISYMENNPEHFKDKDTSKISIATFTPELPREYARISVDAAFNGCTDALGIIDTKHITQNFILSLGIFLTPKDRTELREIGKDGKTLDIRDVIRKRFNLRNSAMVKLNSSGLTLSEMRAMLNLRSKKYSELTTEQLLTLRNKVLFKLEVEVKQHIQQWEERLRQIQLVMEARNISL